MFLLLQKSEFSKRKKHVLNFHCYIFMQHFLIAKISLAFLSIVQQLQKNKCNQIFFVVASLTLQNIILMYTFYLDPTHLPITKQERNEQCLKLIMIIIFIRFIRFIGNYILFLIYNGLEVFKHLVTNIACISENVRLNIRGDFVHCQSYYIF